MKKRKLRKLGIPPGGGFIKGMQAKSVAKLFEPQREPTSEAMSGTLHELIGEIRKIDSASPTTDVDEFISHISREIYSDNIDLLMERLNDEIPFTWRSERPSGHTGLLKEFIQKKEAELREGAQ